MTRQRIPVVIQARTGSRRLPGKVLKPLCGDKVVLDYVIERCNMARVAGPVILATSDLLRDDPVADLAAKRGIHVHRGSEKDVLARYHGVAVGLGLQALVRVTADCPLIAPEVIDQVCRLHLETPRDYILVSGYPNGVGDAELLSRGALERMMKVTGFHDSGYREHVVTYILDHPDEFAMLVQSAPSRFLLSDQHLSVDTLDDLAAVREVCRRFWPRMDFSAEEIVDFLSGRLGPQ